MGLFRRATTVTHPDGTTQGLGEALADGIAEQRDKVRDFHAREADKYQAKLDALVAAGKGNTGQADRIRAVIARNQTRA